MKQLQQIVFTLLLCGACGCSNEQLKIPQMAALLRDLQYADAYASICYPNDSTSERNNMNRNLDTLQKYAALALKLNNVTEAQYKQSLKWYQQHPSEWDSVYTLVQQLNERDTLQAKLAE